MSVNDLIYIAEELIEDMAGGEHGEIGVQLSRHLANYVTPKRLGRVMDGQTIWTVVGAPPKRQPDVAFVTLERMPQRIEGEIPFAPDLAVEIVSPNDTSAEIDRKILQYQQSGVRLVWLIRPVRQLIEIYHPADLKPSAILGLNDELDGEDVIPGFRLKVSELFEF